MGQFNPDQKTVDGRMLLKRSRQLSFPLTTHQSALQNQLSLLKQQIARREFEIRVHGRGGQGGVTCAKLVATLYAGQGCFVQTFGDYASERSGAPVRAYTRIGSKPIRNRNKVYAPDQLLVLDPQLIGDEILDGLHPGGLILLNSSYPVEHFAARFASHRLAVVDATAIARRLGIGTSSVIIVNTTIIGAYAKAMDLNLADVEQAYRNLGLENDLPAAREAFESVEICDASICLLKNRQPSPPLQLPKITPLIEQLSDLPSPLKTGVWRTQMAEYLERPAPCNASCPAGNDVVGFIQALKNEGLEAAAKILQQTQPLPSICGRVCPAPCQSNCNRLEYDGALNIRGLERWIGDRVPKLLIEPKQATCAKRIAIIGGGPAGISAAYTLALEGHRPTIYERNNKLGGVLRSGIPDYRLPQQQLDHEIERVLALGVEVRLNSSLDRQALNNLASDYDAVIIATGLDRWRVDACPGDQLKNIEQGLNYLQQVKQGTAQPLSGHVLVVGGGNSAIDAARTALRSGAGKVTLVYRRGRAEMPAISEEIEDALKEGVELLALHQPLAYIGTDQVTAVELAETELGTTDSSGRRQPLLTERRKRIACDQVLLCLGQSADYAILPNGWQLKKGRIYFNQQPLKVFCAGDLSTAEGTVTHAIGDGRASALQTLNSLGIKTPAFKRPALANSVTADAIKFHHFDLQKRAEDRLEDIRKPVHHFKEVNHGLTDAGEADRCFSCGRCTGCDTCLIYCPEGIICRDGMRYAIDQEQCKGCGICATECPRQAMRMSAVQTRN